MISSCILTLNQHLHYRRPQQVTERSGKKSQDHLVHPHCDRDLCQELWQTFSFAGMISMIIIMMFMIMVMRRIMMRMAMAMRIIHPDRYLSV